MNKKHVFFASLGCPRNLVDTEILAASSIIDNGYEITFDPYEADFVVINTCGFLQSSIEEAKEILNEYHLLKKDNSKMKIIVTGCMPERFRDDPGILAQADMIRGIDHYSSPDFFNSQKKILFGDKNELYSKSERLLLTGSSYEYLKIAEGCSHNCTFCLIPYIKGPLRSRPTKDILEEARKLAKQGISELIVIAQDTTDYGKDLFGESRLLSLLSELDKLGFTWIRVHYLNPADISLEWVTTLLGLKTVIPYFDIPLQHVSPRILKYMGRPALNDDLGEILGIIRDGGGIVRTNFIVGFPGESAEDFRMLKDFLIQNKIERAVFFPFSNETNLVESLSLFPIEPAIIESRLNELEEIQTENIYSTFPSGKKEVIILDAETKGGYIGRTFRDSPGVDLTLKVKGKGMSPGKFMKARLYIEDGEFRGKV